MSTSLAVSIRESQQQTALLRVDRNAGCMRDVKLLGFESRNCGRTIGLERREFGEAVDQPYTYDRQNANHAASLYEGKAVNVDHWNREGDRPVGSVFGEVHGVYVKDDGIYARELRYVVAHPMCEQILEIAEKFPTKIGLSHVASGEPTLIEGRVVIRDWDPECVDIVSGPATTKGLYESEQGTHRMAKKKPAPAPAPIKHTVRSVVESAKNDELTAILVEMDQDADFAEVGDVPLDMPVDADPDDALKSAIMEMITAKLAKAGTPELTKLLKVLGIEDSLTSVLGGGSTSESTDPPAEEEDGDDTEEEEDEVPAMESLRLENKTLKARTLLLESGRKATPIRIAALVAVDEDSHADLIESWTADLVESKPEGGRRPTHSPPANSFGNATEEFERQVKKYTGAK